MKVRIVKRTNPMGSPWYVIQQKHYLFRWWWVDASSNQHEHRCDKYYTLEEAKANLCWFDGTPHKDEVVLES